MVSLATKTDADDPADQRQFLESLVYGLEARYMNPANEVDWVAMRKGMEEQTWRRYVDLRRQLRRYPRLDMR